MHAMIRILAACGLAALLLPASAQAGRHEVSGEFQLGNLPSGGPESGVNGASMVGGGVRLGYAVLRNERRAGLVVRLGWGSARREGTRYIVADGVDAFDEVGIETALSTHHLQAGLKADIEVGGFFYPYAAVDAGVLLGVLRQQASNAPAAEAGHREIGAAPVGTFLLGTEWMVPDRRLGLPATVAFHVEGGYELTGAVRFPTSGGTQRFSGAVLRAGVGVRF